MLQIILPCSLLNNVVIENMPDQLSSHYQETFSITKCPGLFSENFCELILMIILCLTLKEHIPNTDWS